MSNVSCRKFWLVFMSLMVAQLCWLSPGGWALAVSHYYEYQEPTAISPERGFYKYFTKNKYGYPQYVDLAKDRDFSWVRKDGFSLVQARVSLEQFRETDIPADFLARLQAGFNAVRAGGVKTILRFNYNNKMEAGSDASLPWTLKHIGQLSGLLRENADVIAVVQAGFLGAWGEWHSSRHGLDNKDARSAVLSALLEAIPNNRSVQLRTPQYKEQLLGDPVNEVTAFSNSDTARVGHHNDCLFASENDLTYPLNAIDYFTDYVARDGIYVPVGGETCKVYPPRTNCAVAVRELRRLHYSYLNNNYSQQVVDGWRTGGCYNEIAKTLGYQLVLREAIFDEIVNAGKPFTVDLAIENLGWAAPINLRKMFLTLVSESGKILSEEMPPDLRSFTPGSLTKCSGQISLPMNLPKGRYRMFLSAPDLSPKLSARWEYALPFANKGYIDRESRLPLGYVTVQ